MELHGDNSRMPRCEQTQLIKFTPMQRHIPNKQNQLKVQQIIGVDNCNCIRVDHDELFQSQLLSSSSKYSFNLPSILKPLWNSSVSRISTTVDRNSVKFFEEAKQLTLHRNSSVEYMISPHRKQILTKKLEQNIQLLVDMEKKLDFLDTQIQIIQDKTSILSQKTDQMRISFPRKLQDK
ncbi:Hypothetical_protein [Hexamita inflata]|uniref:Hypothetical_protein n=1 Tax=Hexamita inflata TaxID=28002 RepID=A0AA86REH0_9EUKA|nr:Hypothetical protein HINF_LOCUS64564 [Hexamita inflata]